MPSILVETGFISNKEEEEYLNSDGGQKEIVEDIIAALKNYIQAVNAPQVPNNNNTKAPAEEEKPSPLAFLLSRKKLSVGNNALPFIFA